MKEIFAKCTVKNNTVFLPNEQLPRDVYAMLAKHLENNFGKWNKKAGGIVFDYDPTQLIERFRNGETPNWKKEYQFFPTPPEVIDLILQIACPLENSVLEPSAGNGAIAKAVLEFASGNTVDCLEINPMCRENLKKAGLNVVGEDFLTWNPKPYDFVIANPPFSGLTWADHVLKMMEVPGADIITLVPESFHFRTEAKVQRIRERVYASYRVKDHVSPSAFKSAGTMIETTILHILND